MKNIKKGIQNLNTNKACQYSDILLKIIFKNSNIYAAILCKSINNSANPSLFPSCHENAITLI